MRVKMASKEKISRNEDEVKMNILEEMSKLEHYAQNKILQNCYIAVRVDGRSFHREVKIIGMKRPFDKKFRRAMCLAAKEVMKDFGAMFAYAQSDECTFLFPKNFSIFDRRHEKLVSLIAAKMSVYFNKASIVRNSGTVPIFDARVILLPSKADVVRYFVWRQMDSHRNCISSYCFWKLLQGGIGANEAQKLMHRKGYSWKNELLFKKYGVNYNEIPKWERRGTSLYWKEYRKIGYNPIKKEKVTAIRRKISIDDMTEQFRHNNLDNWINKGVRVV